jgi:hypothetical protein
LPLTECAGKVTINLELAHDDLGLQQERILQRGALFECRPLTPTHAPIWSPSPFTAVGIAQAHTLSCKRGPPEDPTPRISGVEELLEGCRVVSLTEDEAYSVLESGQERVEMVSPESERGALLMMRHGVPPGPSLLDAHMSYGDSRSAHRR